MIQKWVATVTDYLVETGTAGWHQRFMPHERRKPAAPETPANSLPALSRSSIQRWRSRSAQPVRRCASGFRRRSSWSTTTTTSWPSLQRDRAAIGLYRVPGGERQRVGLSFYYGPRCPIRTKFCWAAATRTLHSSGECSDAGPAGGAGSDWRGRSSAKTPLPETGGGYTVIKSISAKTTARRLPAQ